MTREPAHATEPGRHAGWPASTTGQRWVAALDCTLGFVTVALKVRVFH